MDFIDLIITIFSIRSERIQDNIDILEDEKWFIREYGRELLEKKEFRKFIKKYKLRKIFRDKTKKRKFKLELKNWVDGLQ
ncbi:hypothetical protein [Ectobacillus sp. sgz5001026]|uniref:hypothetical protein n=1 Tax=Ectobacillus sp. sgz5001026 TaxID=3242473 RepID=UPI0036D378E0